jgi:hypothetical protein
MTSYVRKTHMSVPPSQPHDTVTVITVLIIVASCLCVFYWRTALRVILVVGIALALTGVVVVIHDLASLLTALHHW